MGWGGRNDCGEVISRIVWCVITDPWSWCDYQLLGWKLFVIKASRPRSAYEALWTVGIPQLPTAGNEWGGRCWGKMMVVTHGEGYRILADQKQFEN